MNEVNPNNVYSLGCASLISAYGPKAPPCELLRTMNSECARISNAPQWAKWPKPKVVGQANCVASPISGQLAGPKMGDYELARVCRGGSEIDILARVSSLYGGAEVGDLKGC